MTQPSISIIIPVYNVGPYVEDCLRSVMRQTYTGPMECIIVDDCGTDNSMEIVERLVSEYNGPIDFKVLHHTHNRGISAARNTGMDAASGDYLFFLDSDDELTDDCLEVLAEPIEEEFYDVVDGRNSDPLESSSLEVLDTAFELLKPPSVLQGFTKNWGVPVWNRLYKTSFIQNNHLLFKEGLSPEDILWSFQIACLASSFLIINRVTYKYRRRPDGSSSPRHEDEHREGLVSTLKEMSRFLSNQNIKSDDLFRLFSYYFYEALGYYSSSPSIYASAYKSLRPLYCVSLKELIQKNHHRFKACLHDIHFVFPLCIAPYWQYYIYIRLHPTLFHAQ